MTTPTPDALCERLRPALKLLPVECHDTPDYAEATGPQFQAMTMVPEAFLALNSLPEALATIERLSAALERAEIAMTCGREDSACYCPNCDNSFYEPREEIRAALGKDASDE